MEEPPEIHFLVHFEDNFCAKNVLILSLIVNLNLLKPEENA